MVGRDGVPISVGRELQEKQLLYVLNSTGLYHEFKERLKPRLQRIVRSRFDAKPDSPGALDRDITELYSFLMKETATVLNGTFTNAHHAAVEPQVETPPPNCPRKSRAPCTFQPDGTLSAKPRRTPPDDRISKFSRVS